jgi:ABC-type transport system involved in cytochrome c biogenesis permease subunit
VPPEAKAGAVSTRSEETKPLIRISVAGWSYAGVVVAALIGIATLTWHRRTHRRTSIVGLTAISPGLKPSHAPPR